MTVRGKHVLITGASGGIGKASARLLAEDGARLTLLCRSAEKAAAVADDIVENYGGERPAVLLADLADLGSVRTAALEFLERNEPLDILLNNAGIVCTSRQETVDGYEATFAVNHLAPFVLTGMLLPRLLETPAARIVNVASAAHAFCKGMQFEDLQSRENYRTFNVYGRSKLANILYTRELAKRLGDREITVNSLHPGAVSTGLGAQNSGLASKLLPLLLRPFFKTPVQGAATSVYLCREESLAGVSGAYFVNCKQVRPRPWARDDEAAGKLWKISEELCGLSYLL